MKKNLIALSLALLLAASNCSAARLVITNNSNETIWARINDQKRILYGAFLPKFKEIIKDSARVFHSSAFPIKKVTFLRVKDIEQKTIPRRDLVKIIKPLQARYGNMSAYTDSYEGTTRYRNSYLGIDHVYYDEEVTVKIPIFETFTIMPKIKAINLNTKIEYKGWKKTKRIN